MGEFLQGCRRHLPEKGYLKSLVRREAVDYRVHEKQECRLLGNSVAAIDRGKDQCENALHHGGTLAMEYLPARWLTLELERIEETHRRQAPGFTRDDRGIGLDQQFEDLAQRDLPAFVESAFERMETVFAFAIEPVLDVSNEMIDQTGFRPEMIMQRGTVADTGLFRQLSDGRSGNPVRREFVQSRQK
ncbi:MAG: hypothetical protein P0Y59_05825 [Candidatus Sphingomonas phytovorans]|nr:hypothetical protein [Sphingomonas sp.]WEK01208.1 MAG: hypothetical protein P0Y59_05825 [Sphingomonas sp.]